jgi:hypothetical protein
MSWSLTSNSTRQADARASAYSSAPAAAAKTVESYTHLRLVRESYDRQLT